MFAKLVIDPIEDGGELDKGKVGGGEFFETCIEPAMPFDSAEEVFDAMATMIQPATEGSLAAAIFSAWDAGLAASASDTQAKRVGIETLIADQGTPAQQREMRFDRSEIAARTRMQTQRDDTAVAVDQGRQFAVEPTLRPTDCLSLLSSSWIGSVLMKFDISRINKTRRATRPSHQNR